MSDTVKIPIPDFAANGAVVKKPKRPAKGSEADVAPAAAALEGFSLNSALAEIESARIIKAAPRKTLQKAKRPPPKYVRKRP